MDNLGKAILIGGAGILFGAAWQRSADIQERREADSRRRRNEMEKRLSDQEDEIERLRRTQDALVRNKG